VFPGPKDAGCAKLAPKLCNQQKHIKKKKRKKEKKNKIKVFLSNIFC
jgi:hypothetical protein